MHSVVAIKWRGVPLCMHRMNPEYFDPDTLTLYDALLRQEPDREDDDEEDDEAEDDDEEEDDDNAHNDDGYSE
jgi:hypothetical protein